MASGADKMASSLLGKKEKKEQEQKQEREKKRGQEKEQIQK